MTDILQGTEVLQTHLGVLLQNEHIADFTLLADTEDLNSELLYSYPIGDSPFPYEQAWWGYRGQAALVHNRATEGTLLLNGSTQYVDFGDNYDFTGTANFTVGGFVRINSLVNGARIISKVGSSGATGAWEVFLNGTAGAISATRTDGSGTDTATTAAGVISAGQDHLIVVTYDGSNIRIYVDLSLRATQASTRSLPGNTNTLKLGRNANSSANFLNAYVSGWFVTNDDETLAEIQALANAGFYGGASQYRAKVLAFGAALQSFWRLNESSGSLADSDGSITGTAVGSPTYNNSQNPYPAHSNEMRRYRIGDGTSSNRQIYSQTILDPLAPAEWLAWTSLYTGDHYALDAYLTAAGAYNVVHAKSDGLYLNNTLKISLTGIVKIRCIQDKPGSLYITRVVQDDDDERTMNFYYVDDITAGSPTAVFDKFNYRWPHAEMCAYMYDANYILRVRALPYNAPSVRTPLVSDDIIEDIDSIEGGSPTDDIGDIYPVRGASGRAGVKWVDHMWVSGSFDFPNSKTAMFYTERHTDAYQNSLSNLHSPVFMMTTGFPTDGWSEPQPLGFSIWGLAGAAYWGTYVIVAGNGSARYREANITETDLSNYAMNAELSLPRGHEKATGTIMLANPDDAVGQLLGMSTDQMSTAPQRRVKVIIGQLRGLSEEEWEDTEINDWWISEAHRLSEDNRKNVALKVGDYWQRLENEFRDPYYFPGHIDTTDWQVGGDQTLTNWAMGSPSGVMSLINDTDAEGTPYLKLQVTQGYCLYTRWKGANCDFQIRFDLTNAGPTMIVFRWVDIKNHWRVTYSGTSAKLEQVVNGTVTTLQTTGGVTANLTNFIMQVRARFGWIRYTVGNVSGTYQETGTTRADQYGFVGVYAKTPNVTYEDMVFKDYEALVTTSSLVKFMLIYAGYTQFDVPVELRDIEQMGILWGPQTDLQSPAKALERLLEGNQQDVLWKIHATNARGEIEVGQFEDTEPLYEIDDEIISIDQADISELRPNVFMVDGQEDSWTEYARSDLASRGSPVNKYFDMPELDSLQKVKDKAQEEKTIASKGNSLGGVCVWRPWFHRMDPVLWTDHEGNTYAARIEGMVVTVDQGISPFQRVELDLSPIAVCDPEADSSTIGPGTGGSGEEGEVIDPEEYIAFDDFDRDNVGSTWGTATTGGAWTLSTAAAFSIEDGLGRIDLSTNATRIARLASISLSTPIYIQAQFQIPDRTTGYVKIGLICRYIDASNYYRINFSVEQSGDARIQIYKHVAGTATALYAQDVGKMYTTTKFNMRLWVRGTNPTIIAIKWWRSNETEPDNWQLIVQDSTGGLQTAGSLGVTMVNTVAEVAVAEVDDFQVTEAPAS